MCSQNVAERLMRMKGGNFIVAFAYANRNALIAAVWGSEKNIQLATSDQAMSRVSTFLSRAIVFSGVSAVSLEH
jgi:hypothetical protein